jgi:hypothetical protein
MTIFKTILAFLLTLTSTMAKPDVIIVSEHETPCRAGRFEWLDVFTDQQGEIAAGQEKSGYWMLEVAEDSEKDFNLRRWLRRIDSPITEPFNRGSAALNNN